MAELAHIAIAFFCVASLLVGGRLLLLARETRQLPEVLAAITLLGMGPFGFGLTVGSAALLTTSAFAASLLWATAALVLNLSSVAGFLFTQRVYYPDHTAARAAVRCVAFVLLGLWVTEGFAAGFSATEPASVATRIADWFRVAALLWGGFEALRYRVRLQRRIKLGLADPVIVRRFLLWGTAMLSGGLCNAIDATTKLFVARALDYPLLSLTNSAAGVVAAVCLLLAFKRNRNIEAS
jgi:hypothetical protein